MIRTLSIALAALSFAASVAESAEPDFSQVPGVVVAHSPASSGIYLGSAGIAALPDGSYLTKCDEFGPGTTEHQEAVTRVFRSEDRGKTWKQVARVNGLFWSNIFAYRDAVYMIGTRKHHGPIVAMRSDDGGRNWTSPTDAEHGLLTSSGEYHTAPMPIIEHDGRLWRAFEDAMGGTRWGQRYRARMLSVPVGADLLYQANWTLSEPLANDRSWLGGVFGGWLEGNAVATPDGEIVNILRVECPRGGKAAVVHVSDDGKSVRFDPEHDIIDFPGGAKKFVIRYDDRTKAYWALSNPVLPKHAAEANAGGVRNTLALLRSENLCDWEIRCVLLYHPEVRHHGFQYPDWLFEGDDIIAAVRTGHDDGLGGAHNAHDANFLTFHRFTDFRDLTLTDSVIDPKDLEPLPPTKFETGGLVVEGTGFSVATFDNDALAFSNRHYVWKEVPESLRGRKYTQTAGGLKSDISVTAAQQTMLFAATSTKTTAGLEGWTPTGETFHYTDGGRTEMSVLKRDLQAGDTLALPQVGWTGTLLLLPGK